MSVQKTTIAGPRACQLLRRSAKVLLLLLLVLLPASCNEEHPYEPFPDGEGTVGMVVAGTVWDSHGVPVDDAVLQLEPVVNGLAMSVHRNVIEARDPGVPDHDDKLDSARKSDLRVATSDRHGFFSFAGVASGSYLLVGSARDHLGSTQNLTVSSLMGTAAETTFVDIALTPTGTFLGMATLENAQDHRGIVVFVHGSSYVAITDPAGNYAISGVPVGNWTVGATRYRYIDQAVSGAIAEAGDSVTLASMLLPLDVNLPPTVTATAPVAGVAGVPTSFAASASDPDGSVVYYEWDFEDDSTWDYGDSTTAVTTHVFSDGGDYRARVRVTDDHGAIAADVIEFTISPPNPACYVPVTDLDFGSALVDGGFADRDFTISNTGTGILSGNVSEFCNHYAILAGSGIYNLAAGQTRTVTVRFDPSIAGTHLCTIETGTALCDDVNCTGVGLSHLPIVCFDFDDGSIQNWTYDGRIWNSDNTAYETTSIAMSWDDSTDYPNSDEGGDPTGDGIGSLQINFDETLSISGETFWFAYFGTPNISTEDAWQVAGSPGFQARIYNGLGSGAASIRVRLWVTADGSWYGDPNWDNAIPQGAWYQHTVLWSELGLIPGATISQIHIMIRGTSGYYAGNVYIDDLCPLR